MSSASLASSDTVSVRFKILFLELTYHIKKDKYDDEVMMVMKVMKVMMVMKVMKVRKVMKMMMVIMVMK